MKLATPKRMKNKQASVTIRIRDINAYSFCRNASGKFDIGILIHAKSPSFYMIKKALKTNEPSE